MEKRRLNRLKSVLADCNKSNKWLATKVNKSETTVSNWCTNSRQPSVETLIDIANVLQVDVDSILITEKIK